MLAPTRRGGVCGSRGILRSARCDFPIPLHFSNRQTDKKVAVVGLDFRVEGGAVAADLAALGASMDNDETATGIGLGADRFHRAAAGIGTVAGVDVHVERPKAKRAMVAGGVAQRQDFAPAMRADKTVVVLGKALLLHGVSFPKFAARVCEIRVF